MSQQLFGRFKSPLKNRGSLQSTNGLQCHNWLVLSSVATASIHWDALISNFHGTSYFSNPLELPQTATDSTQRGNTTIGKSGKRSSWISPSSDTVVDSPHLLNNHPRRRHGAQGQLAVNGGLEKSAINEDFDMVMFDYKRVTRSPTQFHGKMMRIHGVLTSIDILGTRKKRTHPNEGASLNGT